MENIIFIDSSGREWSSGAPSHLESTRLVVLPLNAASMHPTTILDPSSDYIYCMCCVCRKVIEHGSVAIEFTEINWGIRIICTHCTNTPARGTCGTPIVNVIAILSPILKKAFNAQSACAICERPRCRDPMCILVEKRGLVFKNRVEETLSLFYRLKVNVLSPLISDCGACDGAIGSNRFVCVKCGWVFCCKRCKKRGHECVGLEEIWV